MGKKVWNGAFSKNCGMFAGSQITKHYVHSVCHRPNGAPLSFDLPTLIVAGGLLADV